MARKCRLHLSYIGGGVDGFLLWLGLGWPCQGALSLCPRAGCGVGRGSSVRPQAVGIWSWPLTEKQARILGVETCL